MKMPILNIKNCLIVCTLITLQSCYVDFDNHGPGCESGQGQMVTENRSLSNFNVVTNAIGADIILRQDQNQEFTISAPQNILRNITTRVINDELVIDYPGCFRNANVEVFIANPEITGVYNIGSGDIIGDNMWQTDQLALAITGSGRIDAEFDAIETTVEITGSGRMDLYGHADRSSIRVSGSGDIFAFNLDSYEQEVFISGSGNCEVLVRDALDVRISGSGNVYYKGNPSVSTNISGSGRVVEAN